MSATNLPGVGVSVPPASSEVQQAWRLLIVGASYYLTARLGLLIPYVGSHVSLVWLPTGIAAAAYWRWGRGMGFAIWIAAFSVNYQIGGPAWMGMGVAAGNTVGPWLATVLMRRWSFNDSLTRRRDLAVYLAAIALGMVVTATNGTAWLWAAGLLHVAELPAGWTTWWTGDAVGALLGGIPLIALTPASARDTFAGARGAFNAALLGVVLACGLVGFSRWTAPSAALLFPLLSLPLFVTAVLALRAGVLAASLAVLLLSAAAAWGTANGIGPFAGHQTHAGLLALWSYITAQACTSVLICGLAAQLLATRRQQAALFTRASEAILVLAPDGTVGDSNPAAHALLGLPSGLLDDRRLDDLPGGIGGPLARWLASGVPSGTMEHQYLRLTRPDGVALEVEAQVAQHHDERGRLLTQVMLRDVTERREAEARVAASERRLREIADNAPALISEHDATGRFRFANRAYADWFGEDPASLLGKTVQEAVGSEAAFVLLQSHVDAALRGERVTFERHARNGRRLHVGFVPRRDDTGAVTGFYSLASDITDRVEAEEALRHSEERYKAVLEDQDDVVCRFDGRGALLYANEACRRLVGLPVDQLATARWQSVVVPEDLPAVQERLKTIGPGNPVVVTEHRAMHAERGLRWMEFVNHAFYDTDGTLREYQIVGRDVTHRKELEQQLAATNAQVQDLYDHAPCGYHSVDAQGRFVHINAVELSWLGCTRDEVIGKLGTYDFLTEEGKQLYQRRFPELISRGQVEGAEYDLVSRDGTVRRVSAAATILKDGQGRFVMTRSVLYDITELHRIRRRLLQLSREQEAMLNTDLVGITKTRDRHVVWKNDAFERILGYAPGELLGCPTRQLYADDASYQAFGKAAYPDIEAGRTYRTQLTLRRKDGSLIWIDMSGAPLDDGESVWLLQDITLLKQRQAEMEHIAFHDALTGLPNRVLLGDRLRQMLALCERLKTMLAVCFVDLDGFKAVNDAFGHDAGDALLQEVARRLQTCVRGSDTVARLGGDEFVIVLSPLDARIECDRILARVVEAVGQPVDLAGGHQGRVSASLGVAFHPADGMSGEALIAHADAAMYAAKRMGRELAKE